MDLRQFETVVKGMLGSRFPASQICYENQQFSPPSNYWVRLVISPSSSRQISLGRPSVTRHSGYIQVGIFVPIGEGSERSDWLYDTLATVFGKQIVDEVRFESPYPTAGRDDGRGWFVRHCMIPYWFDQEA